SCQAAGIVAAAFYVAGTALDRAGKIILNKDLDWIQPLWIISTYRGKDDAEGIRIRAGNTQMRLSSKGERTDIKALIWTLRYPITIQGDQSFESLHEHLDRQFRNQQ